jgi:hypothetical protein
LWRGAVLAGDATKIGGGVSTNGKLWTVLSRGVLGLALVCAVPASVLADEDGGAEESPWQNFDGLSLRLGTNFWSLEEDGSGIDSEADEVRFALQLNGWFGLDKAVMIGGVLTYDLSVGLGGKESASGPGFDVKNDVEGISHNLDVGLCVPIRLSFVTIYPFATYNFYREELDRDNFRSAGMGLLLPTGSSEEDVTSHGVTLGARVAVGLGPIGVEGILRYSRLVDVTIENGGGGNDIEIDSEGNVFRFDVNVWLDVIPDTLSVGIGGGVTFRRIDDGTENLSPLLQVQSLDKEYLLGTLTAGVHLWF